MSDLQRWLLSLAATAFACVISYSWLDQPIALIAHAQSSHNHVFVQLTYIPDPLVPLAVITFIGLGLWNFARKPLCKLQTTGLICSISLIMAEATKDQLKYVFGRTWPETWVQHNPSFIRDGVYGFNFFHGGAGYASFPSGHATVTCAVISVLWILHPKFRVIYFMLIPAVGIGLIGADYHFLSDIIAGAFVGVSTGWMATTLWQARDHPRTPI
jgi:membrane-associated phospholipid phosphatase